MEKPEAASPIIQCSTGPLWSMELDQAMDTLAEADFRDIELMVTRDPKTHEADIPLELARDKGLSIRSIHAPFLVLTKNVWGMDPLQKIHRGVEMCKAVGASTLIVHPPYPWERRYSHWVLHDCADYSAETGVKIAVETMYPKWVGPRRLSGYRWVDPKDLALAAPWTVLDTCHVALARRDILDAYEMLGSSVVHVHLSNNAGDGRDGHLELDRGVLPIPNFLNKLLENNFSGAISLEVSARSYLRQPGELVKMLKRNRELAEASMMEYEQAAEGLTAG